MNSTLPTMTHLFTIAQLCRQRYPAQLTQAHPDGEPLGAIAVGTYPQQASQHVVVLLCVRLGRASHEHGQQEEDDEQEQDENADKQDEDEQDEEEFEYAGYLFVCAVSIEDGVALGAAQDDAAGPWSLPVADMDEQGHWVGPFAYGHRPYGEADSAGWIARWINSGALISHDAIEWHEVVDLINMVPRYGGQGELRWSE